MENEWVSGLIDEGVGLSFPTELPVLCGCSVGCAPLAPFGSGGRRLQVGGMKTSLCESFLILRSGDLWLSLYPWLGTWIPCG